MPCSRCPASAGPDTERGIEGTGRNRRCTLNDLVACWLCSRKSVPFKLMFKFLLTEVAFRYILLSQFIYKHKKLITWQIKAIDE